jgi:transposase
MGYKVGTDKQQLTLLPVCLDDYVSENHICRVISAFIERLDMARLGYKYAEYKNLGNRPYDPRMMLGLYIYGYLHRIRSSRRLEAETHRNVEVMWLMEGLTPDDKTICNFRADNSKALRSTFREFSLICRNLGLYGGEMIAVDGTKIRADNSRKNNYNKTTVERELFRIDKNISEYLAVLEAEDSSGMEELNPSAEQIATALKKLKERKEKYENLQSRLETESEISTVDFDAHLMKQGGDARKLDVCYNVQTSVDSKHHLIVDFEVIDRSDDHGNLQNMTEKSMDVMGIETLIVLADKGYYDGQDIAACEANGATCLVAKPKPGGDRKAKGFTRECFIYDKTSDCYICPCKNQLKFMRLQKHSNGKEYRVYANYPACKKCLMKTKCTKHKYRQILRSPHQDILDIVDKRTIANKKLYLKRQEIVEHPFGTVKAVWGFKQFLCRGKPKVTTEVSLTYLAYNTRRVFNIFKENREELIAAMR